MKTYPFYDDCVQEVDEEGDVYFCSSGLQSVLGSSIGEAKVTLSTEPFADAIKVSVNGRELSSKYGSYLGCSDHPYCIQVILGIPEEERCPRRIEEVEDVNFDFYVSVS